MLARCRTCARPSFARPHSGPCDLIAATSIRGSEGGLERGARQRREGKQGELYGRNESVARLSNRLGYEHESYAAIPHSLAPANLI